ncbi:MAG: caspase family protein [Elusimicrobia bacterium]|nr:caspase family protein [Elusimicrobiota bacterium]
MKTGYGGLALASFAATMLLAGCASPAAVKRPVNLALNRLSLAVFVPADAREASDGQVAEQIIDAFRPHFQLVLLEKLAETAARDADLRVNLSVNVKYAANMFGITHVQARARFSKPDGQSIEELAVHGWQKGRPFLLTDDINRIAIKAARDQMESALLGSAKLAEFARSAPMSEHERVQSSPVASDVDAPPRAAAAKSHAYAVVIGVGKYRHKLPAADFADADAKLVTLYLRALGYQDANLAMLINDEASKGDFEKYFERWLPNHAEAGAEVLVYYSGHGAPNPKTGDAYLVPYDGDPTYIAETGYPLKKMYEHLARLPAAKITVVMDSCFSGAGGRSVIAAGARPLVTVAQTDVPAKLAVMAASAGDQISNTYQDKGHGLFTYYFLKGLKEKGDDMQSVFDYLKPKVSAYARRELNADQDPQWRQGK